MRSRRVTSMLVLVGVLGTLVVACSGNEELATPKPGFCEAAAHYDKRVEREASITEQITILEKLERNAPKDVAADATFFLDTMREGEHATKKQREKLEQDPRFQRAVNNVNRRAINGCEFFASEPGDGS
jgi:hypothetical protein